MSSYKHHELNTTYPQLHQNHKKHWRISTYNILRTRSHHEWITRNAKCIFIQRYTAVNKSRPHSHPHDIRLNWNFSTKVHAVQPLPSRWSKSTKTARIYGPGLDPDSCPCRTLIRDDISSSTVVHGCTCRKRGRYFVHRYRVSVRVPLHAARWAPSWRTFHRCCTHVIPCGTGLTREYGTRMQATHAS